MWRAQEEDAIYIGLTLKEFWELTPNQYKKYLSAFKRKKEDYLKEQDYLNNLLGQYIAYAFNEPSKYPKPFLMKKEKENVTMSSEEMERIAQKNSELLKGVM